MLFNPIEQFEIIPFYSVFTINNIVILSWTNFVEASLVSQLLILILFFLNLKFFMFTPLTGLQLFKEKIYKVNENFLVSNIEIKNQCFIPIMFAMLTSLLCYNAGGLVPYNFTVTSHVFATFIFSFFLFFGINYIGIKKHKWEFLGLFLPAGTPLMIAPFVIFIEVLSYSSRLFSLAIRLFANIMAGHSLLKIISSFIFSSICVGNFFLFFNLIPIIVIQLIIGIETGIAFLQIYVFLVLSLNYIQDLTDIKH